MAGKRPRFAILMDMAFSFFQEDLRLGLGRYAAERGADMVYFGMGGLDPERAEDRAKSAFFSFIDRSEFDGAIIVSTSLTNFGDRTLKSALDDLRPMPLVSIGPSVIGEDNVIADNAYGMRGLMKHLLADHGVRDFAFVSGPSSNMEARLRLDAFRASLDEAGIPFGDERVFEGSFLPPSGAAAVKAFLDERGLKPEAIVCANDFMAVGVRDGLLERGLSIPHDAIVTGFDDCMLARSLSHQFTTVRQSFDSLAYMAAERLHAAVQGRRPPPRAPVETELRIRASCGCVDFQERPGEPRVRPDALTLGSVKDKLEAACLATGREGGMESAYRAWTGLIHAAAQSNRPVYELEETLRAARKALPRECGADADLLIMKLYARLLEESGQNAFSGFWNHYYAALMVRIAVDTFQNELNRDLSWTSHADRLSDIARSCGAASFHLLRFKDGKDTRKGAEAVFSYGGTDPAWSPGPGSWLPPGPGSLVVNMISAEDERFGYFLMDPGPAGEELFEGLRVRLSGIYRDASILGEVRDLNAGMAQEIAVRQDSERRLKEALGMVERLAGMDTLTDLNNRRGFLSLATQQIKYLRRTKQGFVLLFADLDGLKSINDRYGHKDGDLAIQAAARVLRESLRDSDIIARLGGDEFIALLSGPDDDSVEIVLRRIAQNCERASGEKGKPWKISMSVGRFHAGPDCALDIEAILEKADADLYEAKKRNKSTRR